MNALRAALCRLRGHRYIDVAGDGRLLMCARCGHHYEDPHHPQHQWVWVDGNNVDAVVIYREWQRYQRASAERWEAES